MIDFIEAFKQGQTAAEIARNNGQEITSVLDALNEQLIKATNGRINLEYSESAILAYNPFCYKAPKDTEDAAFYHMDILKMETSEILPRKIIGFEKSREGYPCKITLGNRQHYCEDRFELEQTLALVLQDPLVGGTLADVMRLSEKQQ
jgi:hypothetical protein